MADEQLSAVLDLDISSALASIDDLSSQLDGALQVTPDIDTSAIDPAISDAVAGADATVNLDAAGAETITSDIDGAVAGADTTIAIDADTTAADAAILEVGAAAAAEDTTIDVTADTSDAQSSLDDLSGSASETTASLGKATESSHDFGGATQSLAAAAGLAVGSTSELGSAASGLGGAFGPAAVGIGVAGAAIGEIAEKGVEATGAFQRFHAILGPTAEDFDTINVGSLNTSLGDLGNKLGTTKAAMENTAATLFQFARNSGASREASDTFGESIVALAAHAVALNPSLGTVADAADTLSTRIARGGRFAAQFGLDLSAADITARALGDTGKSTAADLTIYEKAAAGAELATERYGASIQGAVVTGSQNAIIQQRNLKVAFDEAIESIGKPLVAPLFDVIRAGIPVATQFGTVLGELGSAVLPAVATALQVVGPALTVVATALQVIAPVIVAVGAGFVAFEATAAVLAVVAGGGAFALDALAAAGTFAALGIEALSVAIETNPIGVFAAAAATAATAFGLFGSGADDAKQKMDDLAKALDNVTGKHLVEEFDKGADTFASFASAADVTRVRLREFQTVAEDNVGTAQRLLTTLQKAGENTDGYAAILRKAVSDEKESAQAKQESSAATDKLVGSTSASATSMQTQASATNDVAGALAGYASGTTSAADANTALSNAVSVLTAQIDLLFGRFLDSDTATNNFKLDIIKLGDQLLATGFTFDDNTKAGLENQNALEGAGKAAGTAAEAIRNAGGSVAEQEAPFLSFRQSLENIRTALQAAGQDTSFVDGMIHNTDDAIAAVAGKTPDAQAAGAEVGGGIASGVDSKKPDATTAGFNMGLAAAQGAGSSATQLGTIGSFAGQGFVDGVNSKIGPAAAAGAAIAKAAKDAAGVFLNVLSPSKVIRDEIGVPFGQGFALGITDAIPDVTKAATQLAAAAVDTTATGVKGASTTFTPAAATGPGATTLALSSATIDQLAVAISQRSGQTPGGRGTGIFIENATFGSQGAAADMDFWARVTTAGI